MPIKTKYKLRAQRPKNILEKCGRYSLHGDIYVEDGKVYSNVPLCSGLKLCYFLPTAKVKNGIEAMRPLVLHKIEGYLRADTKEILILNKNQEYHFSLFLKLYDNEEGSNCFIDNDSSIITTSFINPYEEIKCYRAGWNKIIKSDLPQYATHCELQRKYAFKRKKNVNMQQDFKEAAPTPKKKKRATPSIVEEIDRIIRTEEKVDNIEIFPKEEECLTQERLFKMFDMYFGEIN
jgi:hypothetical protein